MDADGDPATTADHHTGPAVEIDNNNGNVAMIGGHLSGTTPSGLDVGILRIQFRHPALMRILTVMTL